MRYTVVVLALLVSSFFAVRSAGAASEHGYPLSPGVNQLLKGHGNHLTIRNNSGGNVARYAIRVGQARQRGTLVRFAGRCDSACTLYLGLPSSQTCIARGASFRFHAPYLRSGKSSDAAKSFMHARYPGWVRSWIASKGGLSRKLITMDYEYARQFVRDC